MAMPTVQELFHAAQNYGIANDILAEEIARDVYRQTVAVAELFAFDELRRVVHDYDKKGRKARPSLIKRPTKRP